MRYQWTPPPVEGVLRLGSVSLGLWFSLSILRCVFRSFCPSCKILMFFLSSFNCILMCFLGFCGRMYRSFWLAHLLSFNRNKSKQILHLFRSQMRRLLELITGQSNLNCVQSKIYQLDVSPLCRFCEEEDETFAHFLNECPCFISYRRDILLNKPVINTLDWNPKTLLQLSYIPQIEEALTRD